MTPYRKNQVLHTLLTGRLRFSLAGKHYFLSSPSSEILSVVNSVYLDSLKSVRFNRWFTLDSIQRVLVNRKIVSSQISQQIANLNDRIEDLKVKLYKSMFTTANDKQIRKELSFVKEKLSEVEEIFSSLHYLTIEGYAARYKLIEIIKYCLYYEDTQERVFKDNVDFFLVDRVLNQKNLLGATDSEIREIARTDPWRNTWVIGKPNPLRKKYCDLSEEQQALYIYSRMYDNIRESIDCPTDNIINDDDLCDGWLILQKSKSEKDKQDRQTSESLGKMKDANEVFIPVKSAEDRKRVAGMNDMSSKIIIAQRKNQIQREGKVSENKLVDKRAQKNKMAIEAVKEAIKK